MDNKKITIGQMAKLNHVTEQTLRLYDRKNLLKPIYIDESNGYRFYDVRQSSTLDIIQTLKAYGMTLREIRAQMKKNGNLDLKRILKEQSVVISSKIAKLREVEEQIARRLVNLERYESLKSFKHSFFRYMPERRIYKYETDLDYFDCSSDESYELMLRELKSHMKSKGISLTFFHNIGTVIDVENIRAGRLSTREVFIFLDEDYDGLAMSTVPAGMYYCRCSDEIKEEAVIAREVLSEIEGSGYEICGNYYCEVIHEFLIPNSEYRKIFYMIQVPVSDKA